MADRIAAAVLPLTLIGAAAALLAPSRAVAERSELLLAALVAVTALGIAPRRLSALRRRPGTVLALSIGPPLVLTPAAWALGALFPPSVADGLLALGVAPTEVAAVGLVALAGGDAVLALAAVAGSLAISAIGGPLALGLLGASADVETGAIVADFALVVLVPLTAGLTARAALPSIGGADAELAAASSVAIAALVYAALSGASGTGELGHAAVAAAAFLAVSVVPAALALRRTGEPAAGLGVALRDFAVAAALAGQAFGPRAAVVAGVYGVLMLVLGAAFVSRAGALVGRSRSPAPSGRDADPGGSP